MKRTAFYFLKHSMEKNFDQNDHENSQKSQKANPKIAQPNNLKDGQSGHLETLP